MLAVLTKFSPFKGWDTGGIGSLCCWEACWSTAWCCEWCWRECWEWCWLCWDPGEFGEWTEGEEVVDGIRWELESNDNWVWPTAEAAEAAAAAAATALPAETGSGYKLLGYGWYITTSQLIIQNHNLKTTILGMNSKLSHEHFKEKTSKKLSQDLNLCSSSLSLLQRTESSFPRQFSRLDFPKAKWVLRTWRNFDQSQLCWQVE